MKNLIEEQFGNLTVVQRSDYKWGIINQEGIEIVPFGKYDWIDGFDNGLARVKIGKKSSMYKNSGNKWGIIDITGKEVLPVIYDDIWCFYGKNRYSTKVVIDGIENEVYFNTLNPDLPPCHHNSYRRFVNSGYYGTHYGKYAGTYAQDVVEYSDEAINDAFDGDPDAYWNID